MPARTVVIVDDEEDIRELLRELLERRGFTVCTAANGLDALAVLRAQQSCFLLMDMVMPGLDGRGLLSELAADAALRDIPVCVSTATPDLVPAGVRCLPKPINLRKLYSLLDRYCAS